MFSLGDLWWSIAAGATVAYLQRGEHPMGVRLERAGGMGPLVRIDSDDDHERPPVRQHGERDRGRHADFQHPGRGAHLC